ncbi:TNF receptor-associated factor homolog 1a-like isoform X1 [Typha latifolia]|uniref:TNF receptor-associated factor homolog 1a-like isoform X1 n=1 Tax=Typha latifolia TaxID=4733 RepID=UPI003C2AC3B8
MDGSMIEEYEINGRSSSTETLSSEQSSQSGDSLAEWRSSEQVENGTPSTSPPYWDTDEDSDCGPKPTELFGKFTWKIESFSKINKRELRSNAFEVGGYKWYILIYPQGCDVCNHLSLFLCVANHDKLLPGWSHFAQFTIAVINTDPKKSKFSDTLHRFWKKEHDWGWKKFMELSKLYDGFVAFDALVIKAQVQVIREKAHRPFHCLDRQYRRELVRVYLSNVEQIFQRFLEERRSKLGKFIEDKLRWSSFHAFWLGVDPSSRLRMSRDKTDAILKIVVKQFFVEKEVTSTLVMDSLYSGLKALEWQSKDSKGRGKLVNMDDLPVSMVHVDNNMFVLADDVIMLLEGVVSESLAYQPLPPKDDKCSQNRTKDGSAGEEFNKDSIELDERRLTEIGRKTLEIFVLAHIFSSKIEIAYLEAVALKRQEQLIREEEAAALAELELKGKRIAAEKEKRAKKKQFLQTKQKRNSRKAKGKGRDEMSHSSNRENFQGPSDEINIDDFCPKEDEPTIAKVNTAEDASVVSDNGADITEVLQIDPDEGDSSSINWESDIQEIESAIKASGVIVQVKQTKKGSPFIDDSSSTCSTDSIPSVVMNGPSKGSTSINNKIQAPPNRENNQKYKDTIGQTSYGGGMSPLSDAAIDSECNISVSHRACEPEMGAPILSLKDRTHHHVQHFVEKKEEVVFMQKKLNAKDQVDVASPSFKTTIESSPSSSSSLKKPPYVLQQSKQLPEMSTGTSTPIQPASATNTIIATVASSTSATLAEPVHANDPPSFQIENPDPPAGRSLVPSSSKSELHQGKTPTKGAITPQIIGASRPASAPLFPAPRVSMVQATPLLSRSVNASDRLSNDPSLSAPSYLPQSYRNAIMGKTTIGGRPAGCIHLSNSFGRDATYTQSVSASVSSASLFPPQTSARKDETPVRPGFTFGSAKPEALRNQNTLGDDCSHQKSSSSCVGQFRSSTLSDNERPDPHRESQSKQLSSEIPAYFTSHQPQAVVADEFPHLDIINYLLDEEQSNAKTVKGLHNHHNALRWQYSLPGNGTLSDIGSVSGSCWFDQAEQFDDGFINDVFCSSSGPLFGPRDAHFSQLDLPAYSDAHIDGFILKRWPYDYTDQSMLNLMNEANGYLYRPRDYPNLASGLNGYSLYHPANGR